MAIVLYSVRYRVQDEEGHCLLASLSQDLQMKGTPILKFEISLGMFDLLQILTTHSVSYLSHARRRENFKDLLCAMSVGRCLMFSTVTNFLLVHRLFFPSAGQIQIH